jgi:ankyrin repeat protein
VQGVSEFIGGAVAEQFNQQERDLTFERTAKVMDAVTALKKQRGAGFDLEEVMPESFRIDVSNSSQALTTLSKNSVTIQLADASLFLTANNLLDGDELVALIKRIFWADHGHIFEKLFTLRSPTIQALSCRILESISAADSWNYNDRLLEDLLRCGLDRSILAGPTGGRCLQLAIHHKNEALALLLLRTEVPKNPKLGSKQPFNRTPVQLAIFRDEKEVLRVLLRQDQIQVQRTSSPLFVEPQRNEGELALMKACRDNDFGRIRFLLNGVVDVDCDRNSSWSEPILEWAFFEHWQCYDILLPYSQFAERFWTVSGIVSAAGGGQQELDTYLACKRCPEGEDASAILRRAIFAGLRYDMTEEILTILDLELVLEWLDLDDLLEEAARCGNLDVMSELVQLGANLEALDPVRNEMDEWLECDLIGGPEKGHLKKLLDIGYFSLEDAFTMNFELLATALKPFDELKNLELKNLEFLVEQGLDLNSAFFMKGDHEMRTPLQWTMGLGTLEMVECLVDAGALVNDTASEASHTALGEAVRLMKPEMVNFLLQRGADVGVFANDEEMTLLELLVSRDRPLYQEPDVMGEVFQALRKAGADLNGPSHRKLTANWNTALTKAIMNPDFDEAIYLALDAEADIHQIGGGEMARTPLQAAAERGRIDITKELLERGACPNAPAGPDHGRTALQAACGGGKQSTEIISLLLEAGADVSAPAAPRYGRIALQALCSSETPSSELMALLIKQGADINAPPSKHGGITALQGAAIVGNIKIVMLLIDMGVHVNAPPSEREGRMALDGAAEHGRLDTVQLLLKFGAKCMVPGSSGYDSALRFAEANGHFAIADILREYNGGF